MSPDPVMLVVRLLHPSGVYYPRTYVIGDVEIRNPRADTEAERRAIQESCRLYDDEDPGRAMRMATLVQGVSSEFQAHLLAEERFEEALDVVASEAHGLSHPRLLQAGVVHHLGSGAVVPRAPLQRRMEGFAAKVVRENLPQLDGPQFLLLARERELAQRLIRSFHWSRKAHLEANGQLRVLFRWFSMEAIWMIERDDDVVPRVRWSLGFPNGRGAMLLQPYVHQQLQNHPTYGSWRDQVDARLQDVRRFRNDTVHSGFRAQDLPRARLNEFEELTTLACPRVQKWARAGVLAGLETARELLEYLPLLVEADPHYIEDAHGNVIFRLENGARYPRWDPVG